MMPAEKKLSVVVVIYNKASYIRACLDSILAQRCVREIICVDDGSVDGTREILMEYAREHSCIRVLLHRENEGGHITLYDGMAQCDGDYLTIVDGDDALIPGALDDICEQANAHAADVTEFGFRVTPAGDCSPERAVRDQQLFNKRERLLENQNFCRLCLIDNQLTDCYVGKLYSRALYKQVFSAMERIPMGDLYPRTWYAVWLFCFFARRWYTTEIAGYHYYPGRGMTHHEHEQLSMLRGNLNAAEAYKSLRAVAAQHGVLAEHDEELTMFLWQCKTQSVITWASRLPVEDCVAGWELLMEAWSRDDVFHVLTQKYEDAPQSLRERLQRIPPSTSGRPGVACLIHANASKDQQIRAWQAAQQLCDQPALLMDEGSQMELPGAEEAFTLPVGRENRLRRSWMLRILLDSTNAGTLVMTSAQGSLGDELAARNADCCICSII